MNYTQTDEDEERATSQTASGRGCALAHTSTTQHAVPQPLFPFHRARRPHQYHHADRTPRLHLPDTGSILAFPHATVIRNCSKRYQRTGRLALHISRSRFLPSLARERRKLLLFPFHTALARVPRGGKKGPRTVAARWPTEPGWRAERHIPSNRIIIESSLGTSLWPPPVAVGDQAVNVPEPDYDPLQPPRSPSRRRTNKKKQRILSN